MMALIIPTQALAHYIHASTLRCSPSAVREITKRFHGAVAANGLSYASPSLTYDNQDHVFQLTCLNINEKNAGLELDALFSRILKGYTAKEEEEVTRFDECMSGDPFDDYDPEVERNNAPRPTSKPFTAHIVSFEGINTFGKAKPFRLSELPPELSLRAKTRQKIDNIRNMITLRRIRWDEQRQQHVFDGTVGQKLPKLSECENDDLSDLFALLAFYPLTCTDTEQSGITQEAETKQWEFVGPPPDTIQGWLEGQGQTRQLNPDVRPEMTNDAIRFTGDPFTHQPIIGRLRLPRGEGIDALPVVEEEEQPENSAAQAAQQDSKFLALMGHGTGDDSASEVSDDSESSSSSRAAQSFSAILQPRANRPAASANRKAIPSSKANEEPPNRGSTNALIVRADNKLDLSENSNPGPSSTTQGNPSHEVFPSYNRRYAKIDNWGLTGDALNQALWENENAASLSSRRKRAPRTYDSTQMERAESVSSMIDGLSSHKIQSKTPMTYEETPKGGDEPWANIIVKPDISVREGELIGMISTRQYPAPRVPPGLGNPRLAPPPGLSHLQGAYLPSRFLPDPDHFPPLGHSAVGETMQRAFSASTRSDSVSNRARSITNTQQSTPGTNMSAPPQGSGPKQTLQKDQPLIQFDDEEDAPIIERLEPRPAEPQKVFRTMQQQATKGKKNKNKPKVKKAATTQAAVLDRPSPPPSQGLRQSTSPAKTDSQSPVKTSTSMGGPTKSEEEQTQVQHAILQHLASLLPVDDNIELTVQFGLALLADGGILAGCKASRLPELQGKVDEHTADHTDVAFITSVGRERVDGVYLLRIPENLAGVKSHDPEESSLKSKYFDCSETGLSARLTYEIDVQVHGVGEWTLKFDQELPEHAVIMPIAANQPGIYVHYPQRVWDARILPNDTVSFGADNPEPSDDLKQCMMKFIKTFNTPAPLASTDLPDFEADAPDADFTVTKVLAKREFSQALRPGTFWLVSQVWDLHLSTGGSSMQALAQEERAMRENGRLWWEAALQLEGVDVNGLESVMNDVVTKLDPLGLAGLQTGAKVGKQSKPVVREPEYRPYW
ncbi:hypothetical protein Q7P37_005572 [Cladosporium fusiforme]